jgi:hypothetical protein
VSQILAKLHDLKILDLTQNSFCYLVSKTDLHYLTTQQPIVHQWKHSCYYSEIFEKFTTPGREWD